jgi:hypothetical protein
VDFEQVLKEVLWRLVTEGSISYRRIKRVFGLDDDALDDVRRELIGALHIATDLNGELIVWAPDGRATRPEPVALLQPLPALRQAERPAAPASIAAAPAAASEAERRQLTVMFCDLVGSTALSTGRIGIATGPVIVGDQIGEGTASETAVVGETPNLAARLQALAQPNQILVSAAPRAMLGDQFDLADLGAYELKGFAEPVPAWRVLSARDVESRFSATRTGTAAPLVGRQEEMGLLLRAWEGSSHGRGQVVLIQGEAGVGKSRLVEGLREATGKEPHPGGDPLFSVSHGERISSDHRALEARVRLAAGGYRASAPREA